MFVKKWMPFLIEREHMAAVDCFFCEETTVSNSRTEIVDSFHWFNWSYNEESEKQSRKCVYNYQLKNMIGFDTTKKF